MSVIGDYLLTLPDETLDKMFRNGRMAAAACSIETESSEHLRRANIDYNRVREKTIEALDELNRRKIKVLGGEISGFVDLFKQVKRINFNECNGLTDLKNVEFTEIDYKDMENEICEIADFIKAGMKSYFFGGVVLGGIIMRRKARISFNNAKANEAAAKIQEEKIESEKVELEAIRKLAKQEDKTIRRLIKTTRQPLCDFGEIVSRKTDWNEFSLDEKQTVASLMSTMKLVKLIIDQPIINEEGQIINAAYDTIGSKEVVEAISKESK